ncbi:SIMPL domain-containing protein [Paenibacillus sinopodophylli]|uniref:SIMPL domain-containing protein n=1 Tax=Paenibacillus sinopodophylli TaxID=1837342 RepID=UPI0014866109|nr:SIMPL domain-containing protein [Paenibacillus sinopodophylli]
MAQHKQFSCDFTLEVWGEGVVTAVPDRTLITLGTVSEGVDLESVQTENATKVAAIIEALEHSGIARERIKTTQFQIEPQYDYIDGKQEFRGYKVTHLLQVMLDNVTEAGRLIDMAVANGANIVTSIEFDSSEAAKTRQEALIAAVRDAESKATSIAHALSVSLSAVPCKVEEVAQPGAEPVLFKVAAMPQQSVTSPIEPGQLTFRAAVRIWYMYG